MLKRCSAIFAAIELWLPTSSLPIPRQLQAEGQAESEAEWVIEGNCTVDGVCVSSPNFPEPYGNKDYCLISLPKPALLEVTAFETEKGYDKLTVNGKQFSGTSLLGDSFNAWTNITWRSDESVVERGWQFCLVTLTCADGLPLIPVAVRDCPPGSAALPSCDEAAPGDLCEGDGKCGTRTDVNNCYDEFFTYPSSRDVYRKAVGSTGTTTATTTFPLLVGGSSDGWSVTGPCSISGDCIQSGNFPGKYGDSEQCGINMPQPSVINFTAFSTEKSYDVLAVNGVGYSGDGEAGFIVVAWGNITWRADSSVASTGWELCFVSPKCHDGLALSPVGVPDCPPGPEALPSCDEALPGELCEGGCGTRSDINNCYDAHYSYPPSRDVYRKAEGNTLTTTMVTSTSTSTFLDTTTDLAATGSPWSVQGPCEAVGACVQSPNYPENYGDRQSCNLSLPKPSVVTILDFLTEPDMDFLTLHGVPFSGLGPGKKTFTLWTNISWRSDPSVAERGWKICLDPPPFCDDGLPLTPIAVRDCPPGSTVLPTCEEAAPGELCEADGQCGTRTDVNNCYDPSYTYPASRDVYRKFNGTATSTTTKTVSTVTTTTTSSSQSTTLLEGFWEGPAPWTASGGCKLHGACVESSNFPDTGESEDCEFSLPRPSVVRVTAFSAQDGDSLTINHEAYTGDDLEGQFFTIWSPISWHSNGEGSKFQLCYEPLPLCSDGLILSPVEIRDCPPVEEALPGCDVAAPGEFCVGKCGTRDDIDNCYDASYTYPPSRDVYRKANGTTRTTSTTVSLTLTTTTSTTSTHWSSKGLWKYVGPCEVQDNCISSPQVQGHCTAIPPLGTPIKLVSYSKSESGEESGESLTIDGHHLTPSDQGHLFLVQSQLSWSGTSESSWELCTQVPSCEDGLTLTPVVNCPSNLNDLPGCEAVEPGGICRAGECFTSDQLGNCEGLAVYQKAIGTTKTLTTTWTQTATSTASLWQVEGPCGVSGACAESPNFPDEYGLNERCTLTVPEGTSVTVTSFSTEEFYDRLTINGEKYSGAQGLVGQSFVVSSPIQWRSDESNTGPGWQICVGGWESTTATSTMTSTELMV